MDETATEKSQQVRQSQGQSQRGVNSTAPAPHHCSWVCVLLPKLQRQVGHSLCHALHCHGFIVGEPVILQKKKIQFITLFPKPQQSQIVHAAGWSDALHSHKVYFPPAPPGRLLALGHSLFSHKREAPGRKREVQNKLGSLCRDPPETLG